ncbi:oxidoreductase [Aeromicrobium endophyticum]|uniref:Oxidoreductase n=1 Tax=Aeromicrobium endophyticum TaxID=2292704 RepID=A0A371P3N3_9ACTN|nr:oxidoreductase [Aeromicrobium endophyticum]REK70553.1 oxidoreductase [Aeromicrobium endophyticum]
MTTSPLPGGSFTLADDLAVHRFGYGAMQLAGPGVMGPPADHDEAVRVLRAAVDLGIDHIDTSDAYGPFATNRLIKEALHPYADDLRIVTKVGALRDAAGGWPAARSPQQIRDSVHSNLTNLGVDVLDLVNLRVGNAMGTEDGSLEEPFSALVQLQQEGVIRHLGVSNATSEQVAEARSIAPIVSVQNFYNLANRWDDALIDALNADGIAYVPFFPLGGFSPLQSDALGAVAARHESSPMAVALAWLLRRSPNILLIPGTSSSAHLRENVTGAGLVLSDADCSELDAITGT